MENQSPDKKGEKQAGDIRPLLVKGFISNGAIGADVSFEELGRIIAEGRIVTLKGVFAPAAMLDFRRCVHRWSKETLQHPNGKSPRNSPEENYHRVDDGAYKSAIAHIFHQYGFNNLDRLPHYVGKPAKSIGNAMLELQNAVAKTNFTFSLTGMRFRILRYPSGGGFLNRHVHELEPQRIGLILSLSRLGMDIQSGGTRFLSPFGLVDTSADHDIGDVVLFRFDIPHDVTTIDEGRTLDWNSDGGKWSVVLELRENYYLTKAL
jgi:hypothetical protein